MRSKRPGPSTSLRAGRPTRRALSTLDIACRGVFLGGILLSRRAIADSNESFDPGISSVGLVYNPATNYVSQSLAAPTPTTISELVSGNELFSYNNPISCLTYQLQGSYYSANNGLTATPPNNLAVPITSAYASVGESDSFAFGMGPRLGTGTGISQSSPYGTFADPAQMTINLNHMAFFVNASNGNPFPNAGTPDLLFQFGIGGQLQAGASASFGVSLTYYFYPTNTTNGFSFGGSPTALLTSPFTLNETWTNTGNTLMAFSNLTGDPQYPFSGVKYLTNAQLLKQPGVIDIVGNITFTASSPGGGGAGMMAQSQGGGNSNAPSPAGFAIYLPQTSSVSYAQQAGNVFVLNPGASTDLSLGANWTDITGAAGAPPRAQDIAQFDGENLSQPTTYNLNAQPSWAGIAVINPGAAITIASGVGGSTLSIGSQGINIGPAQSNGVSQNLTISAPVALSASQIWDVADPKNLNITGPTLNLGNYGVTIQDAGDAVNISANISDTGGGGALTMIGTGTLTLSGNNTFHGKLILDTGVVSVGADNNLGAAGSTVTFSGGTLQVLGNSLTNLNNHNVNWSGFDGAIDIESPNNTFTISQNIGDVSINGGSFTKDGPGTVMLTGTNTYTGPTIINGGVLMMAPSAMMGTSSTITINSSPGLLLTNGETVSNPVQVNTVGEFVNVVSFATLSGDITANNDYSLGLAAYDDALYLRGAENVAPNHAITVGQGFFQFLGTASLTGSPSAALGGIHIGSASNGGTTLELSNQSKVVSLNSSGATIDNATVLVEDQSSFNVGAGVVSLGNSVSELELDGGVTTVGGITWNPSIMDSFITFNGGILASGANNTAFLSPVGGTLMHLSILSGGAKFDTAGFTDAISTDIGFNFNSNGGGLAKEGPGALIFGAGFGSSSTTPAYKGPTIVNGGLLELPDGAGQFASTAYIQSNPGGAIGADDGSTVDLDFIGSMTKAGAPSAQAGALALAAADASTNIDFSGSGAGFSMIQPFSSTVTFANMSIGATMNFNGTGYAPTVYTGTITPATSGAYANTYHLGGGGTLVMANANALAGANRLLAENGGVVSLPQVNNYSGATTIQGAMVLTVPATDSMTGAIQTQLEMTTLQVSNLADAASSIGTSAPGTASNLVINGGVLQYVGTGDISSRLFTIGQLGATIDSSGSGSLTFSNGGAEAFSAGATGPIVFTVSGSNSGLNRLAGALSDPAGGTLQVVKSGSGTWELLGINTYSGGTVLNAGTLEIQSNANIGGANTPITFNGGVLQLATTLVANLDTHGVNWSTFNGGFNVTSGNFTISENIQGTGALSKSGAGILTLSGTSNTYSGGTTISQGAVNVSNFGQLGTGPIVVNSGTLNVNLAAPATYSGVISGNGGLSEGGASTLTLTGSNTYTASTTLQNGSTLVLDFANANGPSILQGSLSLAGGTLQINGRLGSQVIQNFASTSVNSGPNLFLYKPPVTPMGVNVNIGSVIRTPNASGATVQFDPSMTQSNLQCNTVVPTAALLAAVSSGQYTGYATFGTDWAATTASVGGSAFIVPGSSVTGFYTALTGTIAYSAAANLDASGTNQQIVLNSPTFASLRFNTPSGGFVNADGNTIDQVDISSVINTGAFLETPNVGANNVLITPNSGSDNENTQDVVLPRNDAVFWQFNTAGMLILNTGVSALALTKQGLGVMVLNATSTYSGNTFLEGGILEVPYDAALGGTTFTAVNLYGGTLLASQSFASHRAMNAQAQGGGFIAAHGQTLTLSGSVIGSGPVSIGSSAAISTATLTSGNSLSIASSAGDGTVVFAAHNTYTGPTTVNAGLLQLAQAGALPATSALTVAAGAAVDLGGNSITTPSLSGGGTVTNSSVGTAVSITVNGSGSTTFSGAIQNGAGTVSLTQAGTGILTLSGSNTYTGATNLNAGELSISSTSNLSNTINFNGGVLQVTGTTLQNLNNQTVNWSGFTGGFDIVNSTNTFTVSQNITGPGALLKLGAGTLALTGTNTYTGGTDVEGGTVVINNSSALGSGPVIDNGQIDFANPGAITLTGNLTGSGNLIVSGIGLFLTGSNSYSGSLTVNPGSYFSLDNNNALPPNTQMINNGTLTIANSASQTLASVTGTGTTVVGNSATLSVSGFTQNYLVSSGSVTIGCGGNIGLITGTGGLTIGTNNMISDVQLATNHGSDQVSSLTIVSGSTLDIANHTVTISYGAPANDPVATILGYLKSGYNGAKWTGTGIVSSIAAAGTSPALSVGYADGKTDFGTAAGANQVVVKYTLTGDANLDGFVNFGDLVAVVQNFNKAGTDWAHGNFTYGASTNFGDLVAVVQNFNKTLPFNSMVGDPTTAIPLVAATDITQLPEPGMAGAAIVLAAGCLGTRRRRSFRRN